MLKTLSKACSDVSGQAALILASVAGVFLLAMTGLISTAVIMRYVAGRPILGVNEIVQLIAVALAMLALPYTTHSRKHVRADIFDGTLGGRGRFLADLLTRALSIAALCYLVDRAVDKALDAREFGDATNMLALPIWPFYGLIALGMSLCILIFALQALAILVHGRAEGDF